MVCLIYPLGVEGFTHQNSVGKLFGGGGGRQAGIVGRLMQHPHIVKVSGNIIHVRGIFLEQDALQNNSLHT